MLSYRELYAPAHFGNWYEVAGPRELAGVLAEAKAWGFNAYGDWFDTDSLVSPGNNPRGFYRLTEALWDRKVAAFQAAARLGLQTDLLVTPNHVFLDQVTKETAAQAHDERIFGQLVCPSQYEGLQVILDNQQDLFRRLAAAGVALDSISACPYDYGGCDCPQCEPWIETFGRLFSLIHDRAREHFPAVKARLIGWWWNEEEHRLFREYAGNRRRFASLALHLPYDRIVPDTSMVLPEGARRQAFVHIGYPDTIEGNDCYGPWGPVCAATRLPATVEHLVESGSEGFVAYSEGVSDDVNKALLAGLASGQFADAPAVLAAYAERYFGAQGGAAAGWAEWLAGWGRPFEVDTGKARAAFDRLASEATPGWRLEQWRLKLELFELHAEISRRQEWDEARLAAAERFFAARERLQRQVWGLGPVRHVLNEHYHQPAWREGWQQATGQAAAGPAETNPAA